MVGRAPPTCPADKNRRGLSRGGFIVVAEARRLSFSPGRDPQARVVAITDGRLSLAEEPGGVNIQGGPFLLGWDGDPGFGFMLPTCQTPGVYRPALSRGNHYTVIEHDPAGDRYRLKGDNGRTR